MNRMSILGPLLLTVGGGVLYHLAAKSVPKSINPSLVLLGAYATAFCASLFTYAVLPTGADAPAPTWPWHPAVVAVGLGAVMIELGYVLAYRAAWPVSSASVLINGVVALLLVPIGIGLFRERFSLAN